MHVPQNALWLLGVFLSTLALLITSYNRWRRSRGPLVIPNDPSGAVPWARQGLLPNGIEGTATILQLTDRGPGGLRQRLRRYEMEIIVTLSGHPPYNLRKSGYIKPATMANLHVGMTLGIRVDPSDYRRVMLLFNRLSAGSGQAG